MTTYQTRSSAHRAARNQCRKLLGPIYQAFEGPDYGIHPVSPTDDDMLNGQYRDRYAIELRGPAKDGKAADDAMDDFNYVGSKHHY